MPVTEVQTWGYDLRDAFFNVVVADSFFAGYTQRKNKMLPVQQNLIPYLGVYLVDEQRVPDGDANAGCIRFTHTVRVGFSIIVANSDPVLAEQAADQALQRVYIDAWCSPHLNNVLHNDNPESVGFEGITRGRRLMHFGAPSTDNEMPFCEAQDEMSCVFRTEWYPDITDMLNLIDVLAYPNNDRNVTPVHVQYDLTGSLRQRTPPKQPWLLRRDQRRIDNGRSEI